MAVYRIKKNDSVDLGFAHACCVSGAVTREEFKQWVYWVIENSDEEVPLFFFELDGVENLARSFFEAVGFVPSTGLSEEEEDAVDGIACLRSSGGDKTYDVHIERRDAIEALRKNPQVETRFRELFPFIDW